MKIRMLRDAIVGDIKAGKGIICSLGDVVDVDDSQAFRLIVGKKSAELVNPNDQERLNAIAFAEIASK